MISLLDVAERVPEGAWEDCNGALVGSNPCRWCPMVAFGEPRLVLGLSSSGDWLWGDAEVVPAIVYPSDGTSLVGILPILERPLPLVRSEAARTATRLGLPLTLVDALPVAEIARTALATRSDYWVDLAIEWLEAYGDRQALAEDIAGASRDKRLSQRIRHRLDRL